MKLVLKKKSDKKITNRMKKRVRIRKKVIGSLERPRLCVFKSLKHIYAQIVDDSAGKTLVSFSSLLIEESKSGRENAATVGKKVAELALAKQINSVVFDRSGYIFHGQIKALADGARESGLKF